MRFFTFAAILGAAAAQDEAISGFAIVNDTPIADAVNGQVLSSGSIGEWTITEDDGSKTAGMYV